MDAPNLNHLQYFWMVAKEGTIAAACKKLHLAQPTISTQLKTLERRLGHRLFERRGKNLVLTDTGRVVYRYADDIFSLSGELLDTLRGRPTGSMLRLTVGVADVLPKLIAYRLLAPALSMPEKVQLTCVEGTTNDLAARLSVNELDVVLADRPISPQIKVRAFNHLLGECTVTVFGASSLAPRYRADFPRSLDGAPFLYPTENTVLRRSLDQFFDESSIRPLMAAEFEDSALLKVFGQSGIGLFAAPSISEDEIQRQFGVEIVGRLSDVIEHFYAISIERRVKHPAVLAITETARRRTFK
ncbi:MAG: transcriptional activator NhaR [Phycisphaerae bacterium]